MTNYGQRWGVLGVQVRFPLWPTCVFCLPILFRLYLTTSSALRRSDSPTARVGSWQWKRCIYAVNTGSTAAFLSLLIRLAVANAGIAIVRLMVTRRVVRSSTPHSTMRHPQLTLVDA